MPKLHQPCDCLFFETKSVPVVFCHFEVPEKVDGNFKAKSKHCEVLLSDSTGAQLCHEPYLLFYSILSRDLSMYLVKNNSFIL